MIGSSSLRKPILSDQQKRKILQKALFHLPSQKSQSQLWNGLLSTWFSGLPKVMSLRLRVRVCLSWQNCCIRCHRLCYTSQTGQSISLIPIRHIEIGRRNWLHTGSHQAAKNIAFMFSLLKSCKLNDIDFGICIEDVLSRIMYGKHSVDKCSIPL